MRATFIGGNRRRVDFSAAYRAARTVFVEAAKTATTRGPLPFETFVDTYDKFVGAPSQDRSEVRW